MLFLITLSANASIFYDDDRIDFYEIKDDKIKEISKSIPALIQKRKLEKVSGGYKIKTKTLESLLNFCPDTKFAQEYQLANCSASLISNEHILTAAHCLSEDPNDSYHPSEYVIVFDYKKLSVADINFIPDDNVYEIESDMPLYIFNWDTMLDIAVLKLKKQVQNRSPIKLNLEHNYTDETPLFVLGYPLGVSQKLTADSEIISSLTQPNSFRHHLDTFSVNSGSAIFDASTFEIIGVHVRGTGTNFKKYARDCNEWFIGDIHKDYGEANMLTPLKDQINSIINN